MSLHIQSAAPNLPTRIGLAGLLALLLALGPGGLADGQDTNATHRAAERVAGSKDPVASKEVAPDVIAFAREKAKLLHDAYATTLDVMHQHYFRRDGPVLPARAMEDVFTEMDSLSGIHANWIAVNTKAMSVSHEPRTEFEKKAATELSAGQKEYEFVGKGVYRRAAAIPLRAGCVGCHTEMFSPSNKSGRVAALVISIPIQRSEKWSR